MLHSQIVVHDRSGKPLADLNGLYGVSFSFAHNKSGMFVGSIGTTHRKCRAEYLEHNHIIVVYTDKLEPWAGYITRLGWDTGGDALAIGAVSYHQKLGKRRMKPSRVVGFAQDHFKNIVNDANHEEHTGIYLGDLWAGGETLTIDYMADNNYDRLVELTEQVKVETRLEMMEPSAYRLNMDQRIGRDLSARVQIIAGLHTEGGVRYEEDSTTYANSITMAGKPPENQGNQSELTPDEDWARKPKGIYVNPDKPRTLNVVQFGLAEDSLEEAEVEDQSTLARLAREEGLRREVPQRPVDFSLNTRMDWSLFADGDIVALYLPHVRFTGLAVPFRVLGREINLDGLTMTVVGEVVAGEEAQALDMYKLSQYGSLAL